MKGMKRGILAICLAGVLSFAPAVGIAGQEPVAIVYAHGHHSSGHHSSSGTTYYYCGGHSAHTHSGGVCPYTEHYYCGGHSAHAHVDGSCPYNAYCVSSSMVRKVQNVLNDCGYNCGTADGVYGKKTKKALKKYQKDNGLKSNGVIGKSTVKAMGL